MMLLLSASASLAASTGCTAANSGGLNDTINFNTKGNGEGYGQFSVGDVLKFTYSGNFLVGESYGIRISYEIPSTGVGGIVTNSDTLSRSKTSGSASFTIKYDKRYLFTYTTDYQMSGVGGAAADIRFQVTCTPAPDGPPPTVSGVSPGSGPSSGGQKITITGANFNSDATVTVGGRPALGVTVDSLTKITATTPSGLPGSASVVVTTSNGSSRENSLYNYVVATVTSIEPNFGAPDLTQAVTIRGTGFTGASGVKIGNNYATDVVVVSDGLITATTPTGTEGPASVEVVVPLGSSDPNALYTYGSAPAPTVSLVTPSTGPVAGGQSVTITGTGFTGATAVTIGGNAVRSFNVDTPTQITATTPTGTAGSASVVVTTPGGGSDPNTLYTYGSALSATLSGSLPTLTVGTAATAFTPVTGSGGTSPYSYALNAGTLPSGLSLATDGKITGIPTASGAFTFTIKVTDGASPPQTVTQAVTLTVNAATLSATLSGSLPTLTVGASASFTPVTGSGGTAPYRYAMDATTPLPAGLSINGATGEISGTPTGALTGGTYKVNVSDSSVPAQTVQRSFALAVSPPATTTISLQATPINPAVGQTVVLSATMGASAATGTVTFRDGAKVIGSATLAGGKVSFTTGALAAGPHSFTAVYSGDGAYASVTSSAIVVTPAARPNPTADKNVRAIIAAQSAAAQRFGSLQIDTVQRRLETLHDDDVPAFVNGLSVSGSSGPSLGAEACDAPWRQAQPSLQMEECRMKDKAAEKSLDKSLDKSLGKFSAMAPEKDAPTPRNSFGALEGSRFKVWTAGSVIFGGVTVSALGVETKTHFTLSGITAGVDTKLMDGVKGGMAVSYSGQSDDIGKDGSKMNSRSVTGSLYGSWNVASKFFLDGTLGYGDMSFSSKRLDANAASFIAGERRGKLLFGSLALSYDATMGPLKVSPYARLDVIDASLNAYAETGDANWILSYDKATMASRSLVLGLRGEYGIEQSWGVLSPIWRAEYRRLMSGDLTQAMGYVADGASPYAMTTTASDRDTISAALGLKAKSKGDVTGSVEYLLSGGMKSGLQGQGMRGSLRIGF